jgi:hypothetical protein
VYEGEPRGATAMERSVLPRLGLLSRSVDLPLLMADPLASSQAHRQLQKTEALPRCCPIGQCRKAAGQHSRQMSDVGCYER